jgi:chitinase
MTIVSETTTATAGRVFAVDTAGTDIVGFDPAHDKLDLGDVSVHNFIVVDTPAGVGFMNPWSGETIIVQGVSLGQMTIDSFMPVINDHLRQCLSGALAWEQGITEAPHTVYARSHELGQIDKVAFDPATDVVDFRYYGTREQIYMTDSAEGVVISNAGTGQALILLGVTKAALTVGNFVFYAAEVREDRVHLQLGFTVVPDSQVVAQGVPVAGTTDWPTGTGSGEAPSGETGTTFTIDWLYGTSTVLDFDPATDKLDFGWFKAAEFTLAEVNGSTVITIDGNKQTYTLTGVGLGQLEMGNIVALDAGARAEWQAALDAAPPSAALPTVSVGDGQVVEGDSGTVALVFTATLSAASATAVSVSYSTLNGSAHAGEDYTSTVGTVTFAPGETSKTFAIPVLADTVTELTESFTVQLSSASGATILDGTAVGTIADNDVDATPGKLPTIAIADYTTAEGDAGLTHMRIVLTLSKASSEAVTVRYASEDVSATGGVDYEMVSGTVTFAPGETTQTIHAHIYGDTDVEARETYRIRLSAPTNATIADAVAVVAITNDDKLPTLSIADATVVEGNAGTTLMNLTVTLSKPATGVVTVGYATVDGTAVAGSDYIAGSGTLSFAAGETSKTIQVKVAGDTTVETKETFKVQLSGPSGATIADGVAIAAITNDDVAGSLPTLSIADASITEGNAGSKVMNLTVTLSKAATGAVTVGYATANDTAVAGSDYTAKTGTLTFAAGETSKTIRVSIKGDTAAEANEAFKVTLTSPSGASIADGTAVATITNDDAAATGGALAYAVTSDWGAGFTATMTVDAGGTALNGWTAEFDATFTITNIWNAVIVSHVGTHYVIRNETYNASIAAGGETSFGFQATAAGSNAVSALTFNGGAAAVTPSISVADATVTEGDSGSSDLAFLVTLSAASSSAITVAYATANGTAAAGSDYTAKTGTLTFAAGETSKIVHVAVTGDTAVEANETVKLNLSAASGATINDGAAVGTIVNDDSATPKLSVGNASVAEGASGNADLAFTVTLSAASSSPVTVHYATADGTAIAGSDYIAAAGSLTFAAGETSKVVHVAVTGDTVVEANETVTLTLSAPSGATIATGTGTGTITNDDLPSITITDTSIVEGDPTGTTGWLSTAGNQIVDSAGRNVQIAGVNWFGFEGNNMSPNGLWTRSYKEMMQQMVDEGFNTIRLPFSSDMLHATGAALGIDFNQNPDLKGLTPLQVMDRIVAYAGEIGIKIILDHHRSSAGDGTSSNGLWFDSSHSQADWVSDWQMLAERYADNTAVIGADLHNEPYNGTWGGGGANDWAAAAELAGNAIGDVNPNWLIFVEGVASYDGQNYWWGGNLMGVRDRPIELDVDNKLVYSAHDYPNSVYAQPWFQGADFPANLPAKFDQMWGYIYKEGIAPVYIGEFGTKLTDPKDVAWFEAITSYLSGDLDNNGTNDLAGGDLGVSWTYWSWNPNSGDTGGILQDDWRTVNENKMVYLRPIEFDLPDEASGGSTAYATFEVKLSAAAATAVTVDYHTASGTASAADFAAATGTVTFAAGETTKIIRIAILGDTVDEANEAFSIILSNPVQATIADGKGVGTIIDDDPTAAAAAALGAEAGRVMQGTALADTMTGGLGADTLSGLGGRDVLIGQDGDDVLRGGAGADTLTGGAGADHFVFAVGDVGTDRVTDFNALDGGASEGDKLVISAAAVGDFVYRGSAAFTGGGDNSEARVAGGTVQIDVNGDGTADIAVALTGLSSAAQLSVNDFLFG